MKIKKIGLLLVILINILILCGFVLAFRNPSAVYCEAMGYQFIIEDSSLGQIGFCKFNADEKCSSFDFLYGKCGQEYSYCKKQGYGMRTIEGDKCSRTGQLECAVCILDNNEEIEVSQLMNLDFEEIICGDNQCYENENEENCPLDCGKEVNLKKNIIFLIILVFIAVILIFFFIRLMRKTKI